MASAEVSPQQEVQQNVLQLLETKSCAGCDLSGAVLDKTDLAAADLVGANLAGALLNQANLSGADLRNANLQEADLGGADLSGADLSGADLRGANLIGTIIEGANLAGTKLEGKVVVHSSTVKEDAPGTGEMAGKEEPVPLPPADKAVVTKSKAPVQKLVPDGKKKQVAISETPESSVKSKQEAEDPVPAKSKPLVRMDDAVVVPAVTKMPEDTVVIPAEANMQEDAVVMPEAEKVQEEAVPTAVEQVQEITPPVQTEEAVTPVAEQVEEVVDNKAGEVGEPIQQVSAPVVQQEIVGVEGKEEVTIEPVADPEAAKKKLLVEKLLDENWCVACDLSGVDLSDRDLEKADLERVNLQGANLREVDLEGANLKGANLRGADLRDADMREADLYRADLSGADLTGVKFDKALIDSMISTGAIGADFKGAIGNTLDSPFIRN